METETKNETSAPGFWQWLAVGTGSRPGFRHVVDAWLVVHIGIGALLASVIDAPLEKVAATSIIPLMGILVGLTFAWVGNANSLLRSKEMEKLTDWNPGGFAEYVYAYQLAILVTLIALIVWALAAVLAFGSMGSNTQEYAFELALFAWTSLSIRECWGVVNAAQFMLMARRRVQRLTDRGESRSGRRHED